MSGPSWVAIWLFCKKCAHAWDDWQPSGVPMATYVAHLKSYRCPACGTRRGIFLRRWPLKKDEEA
jgi:hypothetical protein